MNTSSKESGTMNLLSVPMAAFQYRQMTAPVEPAPPVPEEVVKPGFYLTEEELGERLRLARTQGADEALQRVRSESEQKAAREADKVLAAIRKFEQQSKQYFAGVEAEVVQLAVAIAGKILHREAQVDPLLVAALVQIALGQLKEGSTVSMRVRPEEARRWRDHFAAQTLPVSVSIIEDKDVEAQDCVLETDLGTVNFGLQAQLKEVEKGFFDVLAQKPHAG